MHWSSLADLADLAPFGVHREGGRIRASFLASVAKTLLRRPQDEGGDGGGRGGGAEFEAHEAAAPPDEHDPDGGACERTHEAAEGRDGEEARGGDEHRTKAETADDAPAGQDPRPTRQDSDPFHD